MREDTIYSELSEKQYARLVIDQTIETLAYTIDAKDRYTRGHSFRVAKYARMMAHLLGKDEEESREIYLAALLHDIGKIAISDLIINKSDKLTDAEFEQMKHHPIYGAKILEKMKTLPFLPNGALYHHERYDGKGYPFGLKGDEIPEMARIIAVADTYDTMTSTRRYRAAMEQADAKQEIWKGIGTQFDPKFAKIMISLIDADTTFDMREKPDMKDEFLSDSQEDTVIWGDNKPEDKKTEDKPAEVHYSFGSFVCTSENWCAPTEVGPIGQEEETIEFCFRALSDITYVWNSPVVIVYTSQDGKMLGPGYEELGVYISGGYNWKAGATLNEHVIFRKTNRFDNWDNWIERNREGLDFSVTAVRNENELVVHIDNELMTMQALVYLPEDYNQKIYFAVAGEVCEIVDVSTKETNK